MNKKNKKKKIYLKKYLKGFTLVELLAVIVILAIIMIIAIPAVLETMQTAKKKAMIEYAEKVMNKAEEKYLEQTTLGSITMPSAEEAIIFYDIKKDLGYSSTGDYYGVAILAVNLQRNYVSKGVVLLNSEYFLSYDRKVHGELNINQIISSDTMVNMLKSKGFTKDTAPLKEAEMYFQLKTECNWFSTGIVDGATGETKGSVNDHNPGSWNGDKCIVHEDPFTLRGEGIGKLKMGVDLFA